MKKIIPLLLTCLLGGFAAAQAPDFAWARQIGNSGITSGGLLALDYDGNSYVAGVFSTTLTIGATTLVHPGPGGASVFFAKFDASGTGLWAKKIPIPGVQDAANPDKMLVDPQGNFYVTGTFESGQMVDTITVPTVTQNRGYGLAKFDADGNIQWLRMTETPDVRINTSSAIAMDSHGNICMTGLFNTTIRIDDAHILTNTDNTAGVDAFTATYDAQGNLLRAARLGVVNPFFTPTQNYPTEVFKLDRRDRLYRLTVAAHTVTRYDAAGVVDFSKELAVSGGQCELNSMAVDRNGNIFLGGWFMYANVTIEGTLVPKFGNVNYMDAILLKLKVEDHSLACLRQYQYNFSDNYRQIRTDDLGNIYAVGQHIPAVGDTKGLLMKYTGDGTLLWEQLIVPGAGGPNPPAAQIQPQDLVLAQGGGNILVVGWFKERIYFDANTFFVNPAGVYKIFIAQYGTCNAPVPQIQAPSTVFCTGDSVLLSASGPGGYIWSTGSTADEIYVNEPGYYYVTAVQNTQCYGRSETVEVREAPLPHVTVTPAGTVLTATAAGSAYRWLDCNNGHAPIPGETAAVFTPSQNGRYAVAATNAAGCTDTSACYEIQTLGLPGTLSSQAMGLYPNPAVDRVNLSGGLPVRAVTVYDASGRIVAALGQTSQVDVSMLAPGTYFLDARTEKGTWRGKFVKQ